MIILNLNFSLNMLSITKIFLIQTFIFMLYVMNREILNLINVGLEGFFLPRKKRFIKSKRSKIHS